MEKSTNKVELSGFTGMDPEAKTMPSGKQMIRFTLATNNNYKNKDDEWTQDTTWHNIIMWDKIAEKGIAEIKKGTFIKLSGKIVNRAYTDKNGVKHNVVEINAFSFDVVKIEKKSEKEKVA